MYVKQSTMTEKVLRQRKARTNHKSSLSECMWLLIMSVYVWFDCPKVFVFNFKNTFCKTIKSDHFWFCHYQSLLGIVLGVIAEVDRSRLILLSKIIRDKVHKKLPKFWSLFLGAWSACASCMGHLLENLEDID